MADSIFHALLGRPKTPTPIGNLPGLPGKTPPKPTPIPTNPGYNPMGKKKPPTPTVIPGMPGFGGRS